MYVTLRGHVLALERGRAGEAYILGGVNLTMADAFALIARGAHRRPPLNRLPYAAAQALALLGLANRQEVGSHGCRRGSRRPKQAANWATKPD
jgi:hypothetical protein